MCNILLKKLISIKSHVVALWWCLFVIILGYLVYNSTIPLPEANQYFYVYIGFILALLIFFVVDYFRKPNFYICIGAINEQPEGKWRFLHVSVYNLDWPRWFFLFRRDIAYNTAAEISFVEKDTNNNAFTIKGRWSTNLEPITPIIITKDGEPKMQLIFDRDKADRGRSTNISPSKNINDLREGKLVIGIKHKEDNYAYGFNDESYQHSENDKPFTNKIWKIERGEYDVKIIVRSSRYSYTKIFTLKNLGGDLKDFHLEDR